MSCRLYLRIKMRRATVKEQIQWILFKSVEKFLLALRKEFGGGDKESVEVAKIRRIEQEEWTIEEFIQEFWRTARSSGYKKRALVEKFKRGMNGIIRRKLIEAEKPPTSIEQ